jgi:hypothetical protein
LPESPPSLVRDRQLDANQFHVRRRGKSSKRILTLDGAQLLGTEDSAFLQSIHMLDRSPERIIGVEYHQLTAIVCCNYPALEITQPVRGGLSVLPSVAVFTSDGPYQSVQVLFNAFHPRVGGINMPGHGDSKFVD